MADGSLSQFKATLARKKARKEKTQGKFEKRNMSFKDSGIKLIFDFPKLSEPELEKVKNNIRKKIQFDKRRELILFLSIIIILTLIFLYIS